MIDYEKAMMYKKKLKEYGIKQTDFAKLAGVTQSTATAVLNGYQHMNDFYEHVLKLLTDDEYHAEMT